jgi:microcystin-dependent protein
MSLSSQVSSLATRLGQEAKALWTAVNAKAPIDSPTFTNNVVNNGSYIRVNNASAEADMEIKSGTNSVYHVMKASNTSGTGNNYTEYWKNGVRYWLLTVTDAAYVIGYRDSGGTTISAMSFDRSSYPGRVLLSRSTVSGDTALTIATKDYVDSKVAKISSTDNVVVRFDGTSGSVQGSALSISDTGVLSGLAAPSANTDATTKAYVDALIPTGTIMAYAGATAPSGWLMCNGQGCDSSTYAALYNIIGTTYGGNTSTFLVPDLRGRVIAGLDNMGGVSDAGRLDWQNVRGTVGTSSTTVDSGEQKHTLTTPEIPSHSHTTQSPVNFAGSGALQGTQAVAQGTTGNTGGGGSHNNMQPTMLLNYIIKF